MEVLGKYPVPPFESVTVLSSFCKPLESTVLTQHMVVAFGGDEGIFNGQLSLWYVVCGYVTHTHKVEWEVVPYVRRGAHILCCL